MGQCVLTTPFKWLVAGVVLAKLKCESERAKRNSLGNPRKNSLRELQPKATHEIYPHIDRQYTALRNGNAFRLDKLGHHVGLFYVRSTVR